MLPERTQTALGVRGTWRILTPCPKTGLELAKRPKGLGRKAQTCRRNAARPCSKEGLGKAACGQTLKNLGPEWQPSSSQADRDSLTVKESRSQGQDWPLHALSGTQPQFCSRCSPGLWVLSVPLNYQLTTVSKLQPAPPSHAVPGTHLRAPPPVPRSNKATFSPPGPELQRRTQAFDSRLLL